MNKQFLESYLPILFIGIYTLIIISGALSDVIDVDAAQYASITMEMVQNGNYLSTTERGQDYLDKPPFLFWINSLSFNLFGFTNFAYRLPTIIFSLFNLFYIYKLGSCLYDKYTGKIAAIVAATSIGFIWINNDVKTDAILVASLVFSIYYLILFINTNLWKHLIYASIGIGIGMLTKGPMGLIFPLAIVFIHLAIKKDLLRLFNPKWILLPFLIAAILLPMCIGLYYQFDLHPEKVVNGKTGVSGLRFYFWEQSFGRITGENKWRNNTSFFYLFHSFFALIFPYSILMLAAYFKKLNLIVNRSYQGEYYLFGGSLLILSLLSFSSYKIPHYALVVLPLASIIIASELISLTSSSSKKYLLLHNLIIACLVFPASIIGLYIFEAQTYVAVLLFILLCIYVWLHKEKRILSALLTLALSFGVVFNMAIIPGAQAYSEGRRFAKLIEERGLKNKSIYFLNRNSRALEFYLNRRIPEISWEDLLQNQENKKPAWYYMSLDGKQSLLYSGLEIEEEISLMIYDLNRVKLGFLNPKTREQNLEPRFLIKFKLE